MLLLLVVAAAVAATAVAVAAVALVCSSLKLEYLSVQMHLTSLLVVEEHKDSDHSGRLILAIPIMQEMIL
jgi:hypothetical protein